MLQAFIFSTLLNRAVAQPTAQAESTLTARLRLALFLGRQCVLACGLAAILVLGAMYVNPKLADKLKAVSPYHAVEVVASAPVVSAPALDQLIPAAGVQSANYQTTVPAAEDENKLLGNTRQQQWVTSWLAKRYRVAHEATNMLVSAAYLTAREIKLDPLLILSVMAIESGLNPFAESPMGAQGLMQVMSKVHHDKFQEVGGIKAALNPVANIKVGAQILKDYVNKTGSVEGGLKMYVGAADSDNDAGYGAKVLNEYRRLKEVSSGKSVPTVFNATPVAAPVSKPAKPVEVVSEDKKDQIASL